MMSTINKLLYVAFQLKKTPRECLKAKDGTVSDHCFQLVTAFFLCKRSLVIKNIVKSYAFFLN